MPDIPYAISSDGRRVQKLYEYTILDTPPELDFDELVALVAQICQVPVAVVSFVDRSRQWFKAKTGTTVVETPRFISFCDYTIKVPEGSLFIVNDALKDPCFRSNPMVTGPEQIRFYAGAPLVTNDGYAIGALCAIDHKPRELTREQQDALLALARHVMNDLELRRVQRLKARTARELQDAMSKLDAIRKKLSPPLP